MSSKVPPGPGVASTVHTGKSVSTWVDTFRLQDPPFPPSTSLACVASALAPSPFDGHGLFAFRATPILFLSGTLILTFPSQRPATFSTCDLGAIADENERRRRTARDENPIGLNDQHLKRNSHTHVGHGHPASVISPPPGNLESTKTFLSCCRTQPPPPLPEFTTSHCNCTAHCTAFGRNPLPFPLAANSIDARFPQSSNLPTASSSLGSFEQNQILNRPPAAGSHP